MTPDAIDRRLIAALQDGLPLAPFPYAELGRQTGLSESEVLRRLAALIEGGVIRRFGCIVRHHELGYTANAMVVWDVPDDAVDEIGVRVATREFVTLCYRRIRHPPAWPFNLFCMVHGRDRAMVLQQVEALRQLPDLAGRPTAVLFSRRRFKQRGAVFHDSGRAA
jgi:DNA-binding Lrp family transcriptional regulator